MQADLTVEKFKQGNLLTLTVTNFQTFKYQRFSFGPSLNLIAAPNGSGKSSIANSIAFLFNGTPKTIGKSKDITEFIKFGESEAIIEGEIIYNSRIMRLKRRLSKSGSEFYINNRLMQMKEYYKILQTLNINVNNLCTFLPQERVSEFCRLNPRELLIEFLQNRVDLAYLKDLYDELDKLNTKLAQSITKKNLIQDVLDALETNIKENKEREVNEITLSKLIHIKLYTEYESKKNLYLNAKKEIEQITKRIEDYKDRSKLVEEEISFIERDNKFKKYNEGVVVLESQNKKILDIATMIKRNNLKIEKVRIEINSIENKNKTKAIERQRKEQEIKANEDKLIECISEKCKAVKNLINKIDQIQESPEFSGLIPRGRNILIDDTIVQIERSIPSQSALSDKMKDLEIKIQQIKFSSDNTQNSIEVLEKEKLNHQNLGYKRLEMFKKFHEHSYTAVMWLRENKHLFRDEILEPCYLHIDIEKEYSSIVEGFLGFQALATFIVKNDEDFTKFTKIIKDEKRLGITASTVGTSVPSRLDQEILDYFNFEGVLSDFIHCRDEYKDYLNSQGNFNKIPLSRTEIFILDNGKKISVSEEDVFNKVKNIRRMSINGRFAEIKRSVYGNESVILTSKISKKQIFDERKIDINSINEKLKHLDIKRQENKKMMSDILEQRLEYSKKVDLLNRELNLDGLRRLFYDIQSLQRNIDYEKDNIKKADLQTDNSEIPNRQQSIENVLKDSTLQLKTLKDILEINNIPVFDLESIKSLKMDLDNAKKHRMIIKSNIETETEQLESFTESKQALREDLETLKIEIKKFRPFENDEIEELKNVKNLDEEIARLRAKLKISSKNDKVFYDYRQKEQQVLESNKTITSLNDTKIEIEKRFEEMKEAKSNEIHKILAPVANSFKQMMNRMEFDGDLKLNTTERDWELNIFVKFRVDEELQPLTSYRQSGGEKSLSTITFLLALQEQESSPFRLVDEINQGMDPQNEKKVFDILKTMSSSSQFFIITPKLVKNLEFSENTKAIILFGANNITKRFEEYTRQSIIGKRMKLN